MHRNTKGINRWIINVQKSDSHECCKRIENKILFYLFLNIRNRSKYVDELLFMQNKYK